jgi:hypothetical protein
MCLVTLPVQFKSDTSSRREARAAPQRTLPLCWHSRDRPKQGLDSVLERVSNMLKAGERGPGEAKKRGF